MSVAVRFWPWGIFQRGNIWDLGWCFVGFMGLGKGDLVLSTWPFLPSHRDVQIVRYLAQGQSAVKLAAHYVMSVENVRDIARRFVRRWVPGVAAGSLSLDLRARRELVEQCCRGVEARLYRGGVIKE